MVDKTDNDLAQTREIIPNGTSCSFVTAKHLRYKNLMVSPKNDLNETIKILFNLDP